MTPVPTSRTQSLRVFGNGKCLTQTIGKRMAQEIAKRIPAKVSGGRSARPSLMNSQVEPHITHSISQTRRAFIQTVTMDSTNGDACGTTKHKKTKCATSSKLKAAQSVSYSLPKLSIGKVCRIRWFY